MGISRFGMNRTTGYALAIGVAVTLVAGLTLVPALMSLFGKFLFWPAKISGPKREGRFGWHKVGNWVSQHPVMVIVPILVVLILPYAALPSLVRSADIISQLPQKAESAEGFKVMNAHFPAGEFSPLNLLIESTGRNLTDSTSLQAIEGIAQSLQSVKGVSRVDYYSAPSSQLSALALQVRGIGDAVGQGNLDQLASFQTIGQVTAKPSNTISGDNYNSPNFTQAGLNLTTISSIAAQLPAAKPADLPAMLGQLQNSIYKVADAFNGLVSEFKLQTTTPFTAYLQNTYFSSDKTIAKINIVLTGDPYASSSIDTVARLRKAAASQRQRLYSGR